MATYTLYSVPADQTIRSEGNTPVDVLEGKGQQCYVWFPGDTSISIGQQTDGRDLFQACIGWDTSPLSDLTTVLSATISLFVLGNYTGSPAGTVVYEARAHDWGATVTAADFVPGSQLGSKTLLATLSVSGTLTPETYYDFTSDPALLDAINTTGITRMIFAADQQRLGVWGTNGRRNSFYSSEQTGTTKDPKLVVTTTTPTFIDGFGVAPAKSAHTTTSTPPDATLAVGTLVVVGLAMDPATGTVSFADSASNTYAVVHDVSNGSGTSGVRVVTAWSVLTTQLTTGGSITATHPSVTSSALVATAGTSGAAIVHAEASTTGTSGTPSVAVTPTQDDAILVGFLGTEGPSGDTYTEDTGDGWAASHRFGTTGGGAASNITAAGAYKIVTAAAGAETWGPAVTSRLWVASLIAFVNPAAKSRYVVGTVNEGDEGYRASLEYTVATGAVSRMILEPTSPLSGTKTATFRIVVTGGATRTLTSDGFSYDNAGSWGYLDISADGLVVTGVDDTLDVTNLDHAYLEASPNVVP